MPVLHVASYNVHHCVGLDRRRDPARIGRVVRALGAPVVALQEVGCGPGPGELESQIGQLAEMTGLHAIPLATMEKRQGPFGNALLTALPVRSMRRIDLSVPDYEPRGALDVELQADGVILRVVATHLGLKPHERRHQVRRLLESVSHDDRSITVLLGDINEWFVYGRPLRWLHARFGRMPHVRSWPSFLPIFALDRVWVHPQRNLARLDTVVTPESRVASDHLPVVANLRW
jgi:endonuclease/exonuclease/phosphatase family metal-dependent hydrolase